MGEPLETRGVGLTEGLKQPLHIAPAVRTQHALKFRCPRLLNTLISVTSAQTKAALSDRFNPHFIFERHILTVTSDQRFYKLPQLSRFRLVELVQANQRAIWRPIGQVFEFHRRRLLQHHPILSSRGVVRCLINAESSAVPRTEQGVPKSEHVRLCDLPGTWNPTVSNNVFSESFSASRAIRVMLVKDVRKPNLVQIDLPVLPSRRKIITRQIASPSRFN